jgi:uncharacterized protein (TIGR02145 family)
MKSKLLRSGITLILITFIALIGCQKEVDEIQPDPEAAQPGSGLKVNATGKILSGVVNGTYKAGTRLNLSNTITLKVNVYTIGYYTIISTTANGITFSKSGSFAYKGIQDVILYGNGTPLATGVNAFNISFNTAITLNVVTVSGTGIVQSSCNNSYTYFQVANHKTLKVWLDRNLGASQVATSAIDHLAYGSFFQWGRLNDGHQCVSWANAYTGVGLNGTTSSTSSSNTPGHSLFIKSSGTPWDWRVPQNNTLWQGVSGANNPCPSGFRLPTSAELNEESLSWASRNTAGAFSSPLKWAVAGYREFYDGTIYDAGVSGAVWSSTIANTSKSMILWISSEEAYTLDDFRAEGYSVRCIKN